MPFFFFAAVVIIAALYFSRAMKEGSGNMVQFFAKGKEAGFSARDMDQLRRLAVNCSIKDPASIFKSYKQFALIIRNMIYSARTSGELNDPAVQDFLSRLFDYCGKIEMQTSENQVRISTSRQISEGQVLKILVPDTGVYKSEVVKNFGNYLTISRPVNNKLSASMQWNGLKISVYFWREDDAGYVFDSEVIDEVFSKGISSLKIEHNDSLFRTQKRKSLRIRYNKMAFLYLINDTDNPHKLETSAGLKCMLEDISDTGCAFRVNGRATVGLRLKVQFLLDRVPVCIPGIVRSVDYKQEADSSMVRMEADMLPIGTRNQILCEVFNLMPEEDDDDELPLRELEEEADSAVSQDGNNNSSGKYQEVFDV
jgi:c-di-GMP-binding flagellar brake protein YcgR